MKPDASYDDSRAEEALAIADNEHPRHKSSQRHGTSLESTLPVWAVEAGAKQGTLNITCPRKDCGGKAVVNERKWRESRQGFLGRSCTYCFRTARLPEAS